MEFRIPLKGTTAVSGKNTYGDESAVEIKTFSNPLLVNAYTHMRFQELFSRDSAPWRNLNTVKNSVNLFQYPSITNQWVKYLYIYISCLNPPDLP